MDWQVTYEASGVSVQDVRAALDGITEDDISASSPVSEGIPEANVTVYGDDTMDVTVPGKGERRWTRTTERAIHAALTSLDGVGDIIEKQGGRDAESLEPEESDNDDSE